MNRRVRPRIAVYKFSSCDGCQLTLLNLGPRLLELGAQSEIAYFLEASSDPQPGPYDIALVEGSISTPEEAERIRKIRRDAEILIPIGACATSGGIQALRNRLPVSEFAEYVYPNPDWLDVLETSTPISEHVEVDFELWGCPIDEQQLVDALGALLAGHRPAIPSYSLCLECKRKGVTCVDVAQGIPCLGPVTRAGCGALCTSRGRGCYGCFGPAPEAHMQAFVKAVMQIERRPGEVLRLLRNISVGAPQFSIAAKALLEEGE